MRTKKNGLSYPDVPFSVGPWRTKADRGLVTDGRCDVAQALPIGRRLKPGYDAASLRKANQRLIALAPDMADALYELALEHCHVLRNNLADSYCWHLHRDPETGMLTCGAKCGTCYNQRNVELLQKVFGPETEHKENRIEED